MCTRSITSSPPYPQQQPFTPPAEQETGANTIPATESSGHPELDAINAYRKAHGKPPLIWSPELAAQAEAHNQGMNVFGFEHGDLPNPGLTGRAAQNISQGPTDPYEIVDGYISEKYNIDRDHPTGHRDNILGDFTYFGSATDSNGFNTEDFI